MSPLGSVLASARGVTMNTSDGASATLEGGLLASLGLRLMGVPHLGARLRFRLLRKFLGDRPFARICEVGCGAGLILFEISPLADAAIGVDLDAARLASAERIRRAAGRHRMTFVRGDARRLPLASGYFDLVVCSEVIEHIEEDAAALGELRRLLRPGGRLILSTTCDEPWNRDEAEPFGHARPGYSSPGLRALLESAGFRILSMRLYGRSPVTRVLWRLHRAVAHRSMILGALAFPAVFSLALMGDALAAGDRGIGHVVAAE